jgi:sulfate/thiosulfate transport system substrate-binding protein
MENVMMRTPRTPRSSSLRPRLHGSLAAIGLAALSIGLAGCGSSSSSSGGSKHLTVVAYSTPEQAFADLIPAFEKTAAGKGFSFSQSFGPSGEQSRSVANGLHANVVNFSQEPDVTRLVEAGLVSPSWNKNATHGFVTDSVAVIIVRKGNPKHITGWNDLVKPGVEVLTPNPFTSGSARWNILAAYGAEMKEGDSETEAVKYLETLFHKVVSQESSARKSLQTFLAGRGDALIDYEDEAIADMKKGAPIEYVIPKDTIEIENPVAVVGKGKEAEEAQPFVNFLLSKEGQKIWVENGYRPVIKGVPGAEKFKEPEGLFTVDSLGGWTKIDEKFFEPETGIVTKIEESLGVSTEK